MTRTNYIALSVALAAVRPDRGGPDAMRQWTRDTVAIADVLSDDNARFDRKKFLAACDNSDSLNTTTKEPT